MSQPDKVYDGPVSTPVKQLPANMRPREVMARVGVEKASDEMLLAVILRSGTRGMSVVELAGGLLRRYGSLRGIAVATVDELAAFRGLGKVKAQVLKAALDLHRRMAEEAGDEDVAIRTPADAANLMRARLATLAGETFWVLMLNAKNRLHGAPCQVTVGILDASLVHPREVFKPAIDRSCAAVILVHNHPSGDPTPSAEDIRVTRQMIDAGRIIGINVLDHVVMGRRNPGRENDFISLRESGIVNFQVAN